MTFTIMITTHNSCADLEALALACPSSRTGIR